nr:hypothetical protein [uncultured Rhodopila sp.]
MTFLQRGPRSVRPGRWMPAAVLAAVCLATPGQAATLEVGSGKTYAAPSAAAAAAHDGDHVVIAAGSYFDCAVWRANDLTIEGAGPDATVITDKTCNGKALFITQGNNITIRNLMLTRARVPDMNGAGIRAEGGDLTIEHVQFVNNQNGILTGPLPGKKIVIRDSVFIRNGICDGACAHGIYIGPVALLRVERSRFFETKQGHSIKSRAQRTEVIGCDIADGADGTSSYSVEVPNGGAVVLRDNHIQKGPKAENHTAALVVGSEGVTQPTPEILVEHNTFLVEGDYNSYLVWNLTATEAVLKGNILKGNAKPLRGDGTVQ